jgi:hypothetical protein
VLQIEGHGHVVIAAAYRVESEGAFLPFGDDLIVMFDFDEAVRHALAR